MQDIVEFIQPFILNAAMILLVATAYGPINARLAAGFHRQAAFGLMFGLMAVGCMTAPIALVPGVIIDLRFNALMLAGPYGGPLSALIAGVIGAAYRVMIGGAGLTGGLLAIALSCVLGVLLSYTVGRLDTWRKAGLAGLLLGVAVIQPALTYGTFSEGLALMGQMAPPLLIALPLITILVCHLITRDERHRDAETRLAKSEERYRQIVDVASDWFWETDPELRLTHFSEGGAPTHIKPKLLGKRRDQLAFDPQNPEVLANLDDMRNRRVFRDFRYHVQPINEGITYVSISGAPMYDEDGSFVGYIGSGRNITAEVEAEAELKRARQDAIEANEAKSTFLANVSHEIRTPMTGMLGMLDMLERTPLNDEQRHFVDTVRSSADSLLSIVNDVLDLSKIEAGSLQIEKGPFDLREMLEHACAGPAAAARGKGLEFALDVAPDLGLVALGDSHRIAQILINFLSNAVRFTDHGGITVDVAPSASGTAFAVTDSGVGIPAHKVDQIFRPFEQADSSTSRRFGGTGLGLAICRKLATAMGGAITVNSTPGTGSTFTLSLPLEFTSLRPEATGETTEDAMPGRVPARLLVAEDNEVNAMLLQAMLGQRGYSVKLVDNGRAAVDAVREGGFDAVLLDMHMPIMNGVDATKAIRALPAPAGEIPIFALTADALHQNRRRYQGIGLTEFLTKPIDWNALDRTIAAHVPEPVTADTPDPEVADAFEPEPTQAAYSNRTGRVAATSLVDTAQQDSIRQTTGETVFRQLLDMFVATMATEIKLLRETVENADPGSQGEALHRLRGQASNFGAARLAAAARIFEDALPDQTMSEADLAQLEAIAAETNQALEADALAA